MKRTNLALDESLVREGLKATGLKTRRALVQHALEEVVRRERQTGLLALKGKVRWSGSLAAMRRTRTACVHRRTTVFTNSSTGIFH